MATRANKNTKTVVLVNGIPGAGKSTLADAIAQELGLPHISKDKLKDFLAESFANEPSPQFLSALANDALWAILGALPQGGVVETWFGPTGAARVRDGLLASRVAEDAVTEVWCEIEVAEAQRRFRQRAGSPDRHERHNGEGSEQRYWDDLVNARPLGIGRLITQPTAQPISPGKLASLIDDITQRRDLADIPGTTSIDRR